MRRALSLAIAAAAAFAEFPAHAATNTSTASAFLAATVDLGYLYLRPRLTLGYGVPRGVWFGVEGNPIFTSTGIGAYGGLRGSVPFGDLRAGARGYYAFERSYLAPQETYDRLALSTTAGGHASYVTLETELNLNLPFGPGDLSLTGSLSMIQGVPEGQLVYEETLHVIAKPPWVWRGRAMYSIPFISGAKHRAGAVVDVLGMPGRNTELMRAGLVVCVVLSPELEVRGSFVPTVLSHDAIGLLGGDFTELGVRYRWSTGL